jgi:hypothetical protein
LDRFFYRDLELDRRAFEVLLRSVDMIDKEADLSQQKRTWVIGSRSLVEDCRVRPAPEETASAQAIGGHQGSVNLIPPAGRRIPVAPPFSTPMLRLGPATVVFC